MHLGYGDVRLITLGRTDADIVDQLLCDLVGLEERLRRLGDRLRSDITGVIDGSMQAGRETGSIDGLGNAELIEFQTSLAERNQLLRIIKRHGVEVNLYLYRKR